MVVVNPFGPHHCATCLGFIYAANTNSRGASKTRVITIFRSAVLAGSFFFSFIFPPVVSYEFAQSERQPFVTNASRRSRVSFQPSSIPARCCTAPAVDFTTLTCNVIKVLPPCSAKVTVFRFSKSGFPYLSIATLVKRSEERRVGKE